MGTSVLDIFTTNTSWHKLSIDDCNTMAKMFIIVSDYQETLSIIQDNRPKVIIAASGMVTGGRVLSYFEHYIGLPQTTVIIVGYQAEGTRGRKLLEGANEIKMYGQYYTVKANIVQIDGLSAHADQAGLLNWLSLLQDKPKKVFLVHGENQPADELRIKITERYGFNCCVPLMGQQIEL
jgi:metallo-beta-lactamase family protein